MFFVLEFVSTEEFLFLLYPCNFVLLGLDLGLDFSKNKNVYKFVSISNTHSRKATMCVLFVPPQ